MSFATFGKAQRLATCKPTRTARYYIEDDIVHFEEDLTHEFKGHRNLTDEDLPPWTYIEGTDRRSRRGISRNLNGMMNTGEGGTIFCGILDDGRVRGIRLTQYQKDHVVAAMDDVMSSFQPRVHHHQYKVKFIPVVAANYSAEELHQELAFDSTKTVDNANRLQAHSLRSPLYCWCDKDAVARINMGEIPSQFVIELVLKPWDPSDPRNHDTTTALPNLHPLYQDEDGCCHMRRMASVIPLTCEEIYDLSRKDAAEFYQEELARLSELIAKNKLSASPSEKLSST